MTLLARVGRRMLLVVLLAALAACRHDPGPSSPEGPTGSTPDSGELVLGEGDDGRTIDVARGAVVTFALRRASGTGYEWTPAGAADGGLVPRGERVVETPSGEDAGRLGGPRLDVYRFVAESPGTDVVEMQLKRPWETDRAPARSVRVTLRVH